MKGLFIFVVLLYWLFFVYSLIAKRIKLYKMNRLYMHKLKQLEGQVANINIEHVEHKLMDLRQQAQELFAHIDLTTGKKNTA
jgi:hypothetical protein